MGQMAQMDRCRRFIEEFNEDAVRLHGHKPDEYPQGLGHHESWGQVFLYGSMNDGEGGQREFLFECPLFFDSEEPTEDRVERVMDLFDLTEAEARKRLKKAGLL